MYSLCHSTISYSWFVVLAAVHGPCRIIGISICLSKRHNLIMTSSIILALPGHQDGVLYYSLDSAEVNLPSSSLGAGVCRHASCRFAMRLEHSRFVTVIRNHGFSLFSCVPGGRKSFTTGLSIIDVVFVLYMHGKIAHTPPGTRKDGSSSVDR